MRKGKFKVCLEYHLGNCKGPCEGLQTLEDYADGIGPTKKSYEGKSEPVIQHFKTEMETCATEMEFEKAELIRKKIDHLQNYKAKSTSGK